MAPRLTQGQTTTAKVVKIDTRKAKGAGGAKRSSKPTNRLKPKPHEEKPKRSPARQAAEKAFAAKTANANAATPAVTPSVKPAAQPTDAEVRRATQDRLVALHQQLKPIEAKMAAATETLAELRGQKQGIRGQIQSSCVPLAVYDEVRKKLDQKTKRADNELYEKQRALAFEAFGLPCGPAPELQLDKVPEAVKPAVYWREVGYKAAVSGEFADVQRDGVPPDEVQSYMEGFTEGTARNASGIKQLQEKPAPAAEDQLAPASIPGAELREGVVVGVDLGAPGGDRTVITVGLESGPVHHFTIQPNGQLDWTNFAFDPDAWNELQLAAFRAWFETLGDEEIDIEHPGASLAFDRAVAAEAPPAADSEPAPATSEFD